MLTERGREALAVWADERQQAGDAWGELVATSLALGDMPSPELEARLAQLQREVLEPVVAPILRASPALHPRWQHGVLIGLLIGGVEASAAPQALEGARALLSLPCARFVARLWSTLAWEHHDSLCRVLLAPEVVARPRIVRIGDPRALTRRIPLHDESPGLYGALAVGLAAPERELVELAVFDGRFELPWARGDGGSRLAALRRLQARIPAREGRLGRLESTQLGRALWDRSLRVRLDTLDMVGSLGRAAVSWVPSIVAQRHEDARWLAKAGEVLAIVAQDGEWVAALVDDITLEQHAMLGWLERIGAVDDHLLDRLEALLVECRGVVPGWLSLGVQTFVRRHRPPALLPPPLVEQSTSWLGRLRAWFGGG